MVNAVPTQACTAKMMVVVNRSERTSSVKLSMLGEDSGGEVTLGSAGSIRPEIDYLAFPFSGLIGFTPTGRKIGSMAGLCLLYSKASLARALTRFWLD